MPITLTPSQVFEVSFTVIGSIISLLFLGNIFFIKKLVDKVGLIDGLVVSVKNLTTELDKLSLKIETVSELKNELALIKARFNNAFKTRHGKNGELIDEDEAH